MIQSVIAESVDTDTAQVKETLLTKHYHTVEPYSETTSKKKSLSQVHTTLSEVAISKLSKNQVLDDYPPPINDKKIFPKRSQRTTLLQLISGYCRLLDSYKHTDWRTAARSVELPHTT